MYRYAALVARLASPGYVTCTNLSFSLASRCLQLFAFPLPPSLLALLSLSLPASAWTALDCAASLPNCVPTPFSFFLFLTYSVLNPLTPSF